MSAELKNALGTWWINLFLLCLLWQLSFGMLEHKTRAMKWVSGSFSEYGWTDLMTEHSVLANSLVF